MSLVTMKYLLKQFDMKNIGCGAFNVGNMEMIMGVVKAAEEMNCPVIMQIAEGRLPYSPLHIIGPAMVAAAKEAKVDIAVNLDHGKSAPVISQALELGFTSVMYDGSSLSFNDNIAATQKVVGMAQQYGASVECEIGVVGGSEDDTETRKIKYTDPAEAGIFSEETGADAMAVAIGNAHGLYKETPGLRFDILEKIYENSKLPLVLHGGSGLTADDFRQAIRCGARKVNIATSSFEAAMLSANDYLAGKELNYFKMSDAMVEGTYENVKRHIGIFTFKE